MRARAALERGGRGGVDRLAEVFERRERRPGAAELGRVGAEDRRAVAGEVNAAHAAAAGGVAHREPGLVERLVLEGAAGEVGELGLGAQAVAEADRVAGRRVRHAAGTPAQRFDARRAVGREQFHAQVQRHAGRAEPGDEVRALGRDRRAREHLRHGGELRAERRGVEHRRHLAAVARVLPGDQVEQRPGAREHHARPDQAGLVLQGHLGGAERDDAGQRPAGERQHAVGGAGGEDQRVETEGRGAAGVHQLQRVRLDLPDQRVGAVLDPRPQRLEPVEHGAGAAGLEAVEVAAVAAQRGGRLAVDLTAVAR